MSLKGIILKEDMRQSRLHHLEHLNEKRLHAMDHLKIDHNKIKRACKKENSAKRIPSSRLRPYGKSEEKNQREKGKFEPNWLGSYAIIEKFDSRVYNLSNMNCKDLPKPITSCTSKDIMLKYWFLLQP